MYVRNRCSARKKREKKNAKPMKGEFEMKNEIYDQRISLTKLKRKETQK